jgi:hypothetical protein
MRNSQFLKANLKVRQKIQIGRTHPLPRIEMGMRWCTLVGDFVLSCKLF